MRKLLTLVISLSTSILSAQATIHTSTNNLAKSDSGLLAKIFGSKQDDKPELKFKKWKPVPPHKLQSPGLLASAQKKKAKIPVLDTTHVPVVNEEYVGSYQNQVFKRRLDSIQKVVPLSYNEYVQNYIDIYTSPRRRTQMGRIIGLSKYYFPIYEKALREAGVPEEIKYLSIVESSLNPHAVSRVGATGLWQFMYATAKVYGLNMNNYVDERKDPIQASYAAAAYLKDAYDEFGDWLLAIAAYNCGKGNVWRAINKTGSYDFWEIRRYLPAETRGYVPAFIAVAYSMNYSKNHDIIQEDASFALNTDTIMVDKFVPLSKIAGVLEVDSKDLLVYNPSYKKQIINGTTDAPRRLVVPQIDRMHYEALYAALNNTENIMDHQAVFVSNDDSYGGRDKKVSVASAGAAKYYKVRRGENLSAIADKYGVEVQDIKAWNGLRSSRVVAGQRLKIASSDNGRYSAPAKTAKPVKASFATYKVKAGDTLSDIAEKFDGATVKQLKASNGLKSSQLKAGMVLKINKG